MRQSSADMVVMDEVVFKKETLFCGTKSGKKRLKKLPPAMKEFDTVMAVSHR
jgi:hypothetical protein